MQTSARSNVEAFAFDEAILAFDKSARVIDHDNHLMVAGNVLTRAEVSPYRGEEVPSWRELGLDPHKIYKLYRPASEIKKGIATLHGKPLLLRHEPVSASDHPRDLTIGTVTNPRFDDKKEEAIGDLSVWDQEGIDSIQSSLKRNLSLGYHYEPVMKAGVTPQGEPFDGLMTRIKYNHITICPEPRVKGAMVADSATGFDDPAEALDAALAEDAALALEWETPGARRLLMALDRMISGGALDEVKHKPKGPGGGQFMAGNAGGGASAGGSKKAKAPKPAGEKKAKAEKPAAPKEKAPKAPKEPKPKAEKKAKAEKYVAEPMDTRAYGPNVEQIRAHATRVVHGKIPAQVRKELSAAVKAGVLGRLKKDGLKPEIFYHPDHKNGAIERQKREAEYAISSIRKVVDHPLSE